MKDVYDESTYDYLTPIANLFCLTANFSFDP